MGDQGGTALVLECGITGERPAADGTPKSPTTWPWADAIVNAWNRITALPRASLTSRKRPTDQG